MTIFTYRSFFHIIFFYCFNCLQNDLKCISCKQGDIISICFLSSGFKQRYFCLNETELYSSNDKSWIHLKQCWKYAFNLGKVLIGNSLRFISCLYAMFRYWCDRFSWQIEFYLEKNTNEKTIIFNILIRIKQFKAKW